MWGVGIEPIFKNGENVFAGEWFVDCAVTGIVVVGRIER